MPWHHYDGVLRTMTKEREAREIGRPHELDYTPLENPIDQLGVGSIVFN